MLDKLYGKTLSVLGEGWVICSNGVVWKLNLADPCHRWIVYGKYEGGSGIDLAREKLKDGGVYIDSGANIGQWLLYIAHLNGVKTIAFEPTTSERNLLSQCTKLHNDWDVTILPLGLGSTTTSMQIQKDGPRSTTNLDWYKDKDLERETIEIRRLDAVLSDMAEKRVTFWKLDVEGAELEALKGSEQYLREQKIENIYFECHPSNYKEIVKLLEHFNYAIFDLIDGQLIPKVAKEILATEDLVATPKPNAESV